MITGAPINVKDFGAKGDGVTNDLAALQAASAYIQAQGGGTLVFPFGTYLISGQTFAAGVGIVNAIPVVNNTEGVISLKNCTLPVVIEGNGSTIVNQSGMYYGAFNKNTKAPCLQTDPLVTFGYGFNMFAFSNNVSVSLSNFELDGSIDQAIAGGQVGDTGWQLPGVGIRSFLGLNVSINNVYSHHNGLDGILLSDIGVTESTISHPVSITNCQFSYNGRQGMSWTGGNNLTVIGCLFSHSGLNGVIASAPQAGLDIEEEGGKCLNGNFIGCEFTTNGGAGCLTAFDARNVNFTNCRFIGTQSNSLYQVGREYTFVNCYFNGQAIRPGNGSTAAVPTIYASCFFDMDVAHSPTGTIAGQFHNFDDSANTVVDNCVFSSKDGAFLPYCASADVFWRNCTFTQTGFNTSVLRGIFSGYTRITTNGGLDQSFSVFHDTMFINGVQINTEAGVTSAWTPVLFGSSSNGTITSVGATILKIGKLVTVKLQDITWSAAPVGGDMSIRGLPTNSTSRVAINIVGFSAGSISTGAATSVIQAYMEPSSTAITFSTKALQTGVLTPIANTALGATGIFYGFTFSYISA